MRDSQLIACAKRALGDVTPVAADCGELCGRACCGDNPHTPGDRRGMLLFPGEAEIMAGLRFPSLSRLSFPGFERPVWFMSCSGRCPRNARPLACRIFPLVPFVAKRDRHMPVPPYSLIGDPRGRFLCPLLQDGNRHISEEFYKGVDGAASILWQSAGLRRFTVFLSTLLDDYIRFF